MKGRVKPGRRAAALVLAIVGSCALAAGALAATLHARAHPSTAHVNSPVTVTLSGTFKKSELKGRSHKAELISFVQLNAAPCKSNGAKEAAAGANLYYAAAISHSPFSHSDTKSGNRVTTFRICAYLYPRQITKTTHDKPLGRATVKFTIKP